MPASINLSLLAGSFGFKLPTLFENSFFLKKIPAIMESILFRHDR